MSKTGLAIGLVLFVATSCSGSGDSGGTGGSGSGGQSGDAGNPCPTGECLADGGCISATGPTGNGMCTGSKGECLGCKCASPDTPIATPFGNRRIADLQIGDVVYSVDHGRLRPVPLVETHRTPVHRHSVTRIELETGTVLEISPVHPTADGRTFADLRAGEQVDGVRVVSTELVAYEKPFTYDILPASDTGTYFAGGVLIGSTLAHDTAIESKQTAPTTSKSAPGLR